MFEMRTVVGRNMWVYPVGTSSAVEPQANTVLDLRWLRSLTNNLPDSRSVKDAKIRVGMKVRTKSRLM